MMTQTLTPALRLGEVDNPSSLLARFGPQDPLRLDCGVDLAPFQIAYQTYGELDSRKANAVLVCHALTADQHVANRHPVTGAQGWWTTMVGPGRPIDTNRFFVICTNVLGACMGTTGPASTNPATGKPWGLDFPMVTIRDMVRAQAKLIDRFGIESLFCVLGGSMGGMQVLQWAASYPERVFCALPIATAAKHSAQNIAFHEVGRQAVMADPDWRKGRYVEEGTRPSKGLGVARMAAHITYLSEKALHRKFGRNLQDREAPTFSFDADFQVESYLRHQGMSFVERFDANSYLYVTRAMDYFDLAADYGGVLARAFQGSRTRFCVVSFTSDWLFPTADSRATVHALNAAGGSVSFVEIATDRGHDAFLLDVPELFATTGGFIDAAARARGLGPAAVFSEKNASGLQNDRAAERGEATPVLPSSRFGSSR
jgi:homoserine O-acetyltransferase/O-succinyltransferase